jgi:hypothetical protein
MSSNSHYVFNTQLIDDWLLRVEKLPSAMLSPFFCHAVQILWQRSRATLSELILMFIYERALSNSQDNQPCLLTLQILPTGIVTDKFLADAHQYSSLELLTAFRSFIIEIFFTLSNLNDGILVEPLYAILNSIKPDDMTENCN